MSAIPARRQERAALIKIDRNEFPSGRQTSSRHDFERYLMLNDVLPQRPLRGCWLSHFPGSDRKYLILQPLLKFQVALYQQRGSRLIFRLDSSRARSAPVKLSYRPVKICLVHSCGSGRKCSGCAERERRFWCTRRRPNEIRVSCRVLFDGKCERHLSAPIVEPSRRATLMELFSIRNILVYDISDRIGDLTVNARDDRLN